MSRSPHRIVYRIDCIVSPSKAAISARPTKSAKPVKSAKSAPKLRRNSAGNSRTVISGVNQTVWLATVTMNSLYYSCLICCGIIDSPVQFQGTLQGRR